MENFGGPNGNLRSNLRSRSKRGDVIDVNVKDV